jgi:hypothetical protein
MSELEKAYNVPGTWKGSHALLSDVFVFISQIIGDALTPNNNEFEIFNKS